MTIAFSLHYVLSKAEREVSLHRNAINISPCARYTYQTLVSAHGDRPVVLF